MRKKLAFKNLTKPIVLASCFLALTLLRPHSFPTVGNLSNVLWSISVYGIMTCGTIFVFLVGGIDLSIGSLCGLCSVACVMIIRACGNSVSGVVLGILAALAVGCFCGLIHGLLTTLCRVPAFLITFSTAIIYLGISMALTGNKILSCMEPALFTGISTKKLLSFPIPVYLMVLVAVIGWFVLSKTALGRQYYAVGGNPAAARLSGVNDRLLTIMAYVLSGLSTAMGGVVLASMTQQCMASTGSGYEKNVILAAVIGGVSLLGGEGGIAGCIFGVVLIGMLNNGLSLLSIPSTEHDLYKGVIIIAAVAFDMLSRTGGIRIFRKRAGGERA